MNYCFNCMNELASSTGKFCPRCGKPIAIDTAVHHLRPGTRLNNKYIVGKVLGEGGFGITYVGKDTTLDIKVAVKEYYPGGFAARSGSESSQVIPVTEDKSGIFEKGKADFLQEARRIAKFNGVPGVVGVREFFEANGTAYIIMEYLDGENLSRYLSRRGVFAPEKIFELMLPVVQALQHIHAEGLIHRDISPDNIMLLNSGQLVLMDFGSARYYTNRSKQMSVLLKKGYAPEEQYRSNGVQGPWTDVYSVCATMYCCITGHSPVDSLDRLREDPLIKPSAYGVPISPAMEGVLLYGMAVYRQNRCQNMSELAQLMSAALRDPAAVPVGQQMISQTVPYGDRCAPRQRMNVQGAGDPQQNLTYGDEFADRNRQASQPAEPEPKKKSYAAVIIAIIVAVALIAAGAVAVYFLFFKDDTSGSGPSSSSSSVSEQPSLAPTEKLTEKDEEEKASEPETSPTEREIDDEIAGRTEAPTSPPTKEPTTKETTKPDDSDDGPDDGSDDDSVTDASQFASATADSTLDDQKDAEGVVHTYSPENVLNDDDTCWSTNGSGVGKSITLKLPEKQRVSGLDIVNGYAGTVEQYEENSMPVKIRCTFSDGEEEILYPGVSNADGRNSIESLYFDQSHVTTEVRITILEIEKGTKYEDTCITYIAPF